MYPYHVFDLEPAGTFGMYPICYWWVSGGCIQPEPAMYSRCFCWFPGPLTPSVGRSVAESPCSPGDGVAVATPTSSMPHKGYATTSQTVHVAPSVELEHSEHTLTTLILVCRLTPSPT